MRAVGTIGLLATTRHSSRPHPSRFDEEFGAIWTLAVLGNDAVYGAVSRLKSWNLTGFFLRSTPEQRMIELGSAGDEANAASRRQKPTIIN